MAPSGGILDKELIPSSGRKELMRHLQKGVKLKQAPLVRIQALADWPVKSLVCPISLKEKVEFRAKHFLRVRSHENTPRGSLFKILLL